MQELEVVRVCAQPRRAQAPRPPSAAGQLLADMARSCGRPHKREKKLHHSARKSGACIDAMASVEKAIEKVERMMEVLESEPPAPSTCAVQSAHINPH